MRSRSYARKTQLDAVATQFIPQQDMTIKAYVFTKSMPVEKNIKLRSNISLSLVYRKFNYN